MPKKAATMAISTSFMPKNIAMDDEKDRHA
jgi:hypothetical protein